VQPAAPATPAATQPAARAPALEAEKKRQAASEYRVKAGDNLSRIAGQLKPVDVSLDQMLVALYRANPEAFAGKNMNRLKAGRILAVPDADSVRATATEGEARGVVVAHAADFNAYRSKLAGQVATSAPAKEPEATQSVAGKITAKVEERATPANEAQDKLKLSKANPASAPAGGKTAMAVEDKIAKEKRWPTRPTGSRSWRRTSATWKS
jgi:pilus assembly protein FimV